MSNQKHIMVYIEELIEHIEELKKKGINLGKLDGEINEFRIASGFDTYKRLVLDANKGDSDTIIISSHAHNVVDIVSHIE